MTPVTCFSEWIEDSVPEDLGWIFTSLFYFFACRHSSKYRDLTGPNHPSAFIPRF